MSIPNTPHQFITTSKRILSIDTFRGITFFLMIIVNEIHGVTGISPWLKHMPADANAMSFPDIIFPAFLFIVGMSIPFSLQQRQKHGDHFLQLNWHIATRALALITMGIFMVNAESGYHQTSMAISINTWTMLSYLAFFLIWGSIRPYRLVIRCAGILLLLILALLYRSGVSGQDGMTVQWWGILGLIGWAYFIACLLFQLSRNNPLLIALSLLLCTGYYILAHHFDTPSSPIFLLSQKEHASHTMIVLAGVLCSIVFFQNKAKENAQHTLIAAALFALVATCIAYFLQTEYHLSKIYATPSWAWYSIAICILSLSILHYVIDLAAYQRWTIAFKAAAINPLVFYLLPFILEGIYRYLHIQSPAHYFQGSASILVAICYASILMFILSKLNARGIKMQF